jgi:iron-sulfur cluster repair protein YtfE (RIC family)
MAPSRLVAALVQSNLMRAPVMSAAEIAALQESNRELAAIGRNVNQIAKAINEAFHHTERVRLDKLVELAQAIQENRATIRALVRASQNAWNAD